jgi:hypothetical protein
MSQPSFAVLRADIARELRNVRRLVAEAQELGDRFTDWPETVRVRTGGGILHDFYCGLERIFRLVATRIDQDLPSGSDWHVQLLHRMATDIETVRPAVLDDAAARQLEAYLRFRHLFRNIYGFELEWDRCRHLLVDLPVMFEALVQRLAAFDEFLHSLEHDL